MTDRDLLAKRLWRVETCVKKLREKSHPEKMEDDDREQSYIERLLQIAIQAALQAGAHVISDQKLGEPPTQRQVFEILGRAGWLAPDLAERLAKMVSFRNILVHDYEDVDLGIVRDIVEHRLGDLLDFVAAIRSRL